MEVSQFSKRKVLKIKQTYRTKWQLLRVCTHQHLLSYFSNPLINMSFVSMVLFTHNLWFGTKLYSVDQVSIIHKLRYTNVHMCE